MLSAAGSCHIHNESVSEKPSPLLQGLNGERWRCSKEKNPHNNTQEVFKSLCVLGLLLQAGYTL